MVPSPSTLAVAAAVAGLASASPAAAAPRTKIGTTFSVNQVRSDNFVPHGPAQLAKVYAKYGAAMPDGLAQFMTNLEAMLDLKRRDSGSAKASPEQYDIQYLTPVQIGTPAQTLNLDFDSGSSDLWVFSSETPTGSVNGQAQYDPSKSSSAKRVNGATWNITYGDQSSSDGIVFHDTVNVGGVSVDAQAVEAATTVSRQFAVDSNNDGLLGLAFSKINTVQPTQEKTFFDNVKANLDSPVWTADLKHNEPGTYDFGVIDKSKYTGEITYTDVDSSDGFWMFEAAGYGIGNSTAFKASPFKGIADTGTTLAMLPEALVTQYYSKVAGAKMDQTQGGYVFSCQATLPDFIFGVGSARYTIPGAYINYAPVDASGKQCFGGIQADTGIGFSIMGDIWLKSVFVVFDGSDSPRLGWAKKTL
ncbi:secreted aspartic proteinase precursor [Xylariaceae sp. FL0016]|nr:secreted aspartic proteinase precursor [Xylariaceae sp. FL0016]